MAAALLMAPMVAAADEHEDVILENDFEESLGSWGPRGPGDGVPSVELTTTDAHTGAQSALISERGQDWHGIGIDVTDTFADGETYTVDLWMRTGEGEADTDARISVQRTTGAEDAYDTIVTVEDVGADWVNVTGEYTMAAAESALLYVETVGTTVDFLIDDVVVTGAAPGEVDLSLTPLQDAVPWPLGVAIDARETTGASSELVLHHYNQITAENHMKPDFIQPEEGVFTFDAADELIQFALDHDLDVYGHTLIWHSQTPDWFFTDGGGEALTDAPEDQALLLERMRTHINTTVDHFRDTFGEYGTPENPIVAYDVVNEAISEAEADGLRRSPWYEVLGEEYLDHAFAIASEAFNGGNTTDPPVLLFLNDYNTELPAKRAAMIAVAERLLDRGVPVSGLGHQFHVTLAQPISQLRASLDAFGELGLPMAVTELDVGIPGAITNESLIQQGWYYAELFELFREYPDLFSVTIWGPYDSRSWRAEGAPLPFDSRLGAKHAYWGVVDPDQLPVAIQVINVHHGEIEPGEDATGAPEWDLLPEHAIGTDHGFSVRWTEEHLNVLVRVTDDTDDGGDLVSVFAAGEQFDVGRDGTSEASNSVVTGTDDGYLVFAQIPVDDLAEGEQVPFDVRISDDGEPTSWNDLNHTQESGEDLGVLTLVEPVAFVQVPQAEQALVIDADDEGWQVDAAWEQAPVVSTQVQVEGSPGAEAEVRLLWHDDRLYALLEVADAELDRTNSNAWEQDSVEIFLDPVNAKSGPYNAEDGQYRINFDNQVSFGGEAGIGDNLTSRTQLTGEGYLVEAALDLGYVAEPGQFLGVEFQVNDAADGSRTSVRTWTDPTGLSYQDTSRWGVVELVSATDDDGNGDGGNGDGGNGDDETPAPRIELSADRVEPGDTLVATGINFAPGEAISGLLESDPIDLGSVTANADGVVVFSIEVPLDIEAGEHTITLTGEVSGEAVATFEVVEVSGATGDGDGADSGAGSSLPATGTAGLAALVLLALLASATGLMLRRRRMT